MLFYCYSGLMLVKLYLFILVRNNITQNGILHYMEKELTTYY